ncbi:meiotic nuclear division protein 1 [Vairimorpha necatrix]|uniref:Meiotic nuclear division protein 1 n=1 Tax=Vairimorpha necatrix TaxID=6039 RepID=A0AAX4JEY5_9MICR
MAKKMMLEEKRTKMLEIFDKYKTFYKIQELEKIGSKEKGIVENTIKDVVQGLFYDDLICSEKVGTSVYYWKKSSLLGDLKNIKKFDQENQEYKNKIQKIRLNIEEEKSLKKITEERVQKINEMKSLENMIDFIEEDLEEYSELKKSDFLEIQERDSHLGSEINQITDGIFILQDYISKKFNIDKETINKTFQISDELDYV